MPLTSKEIENNRKANYKKYQAHIPKYLATAFDEKLKKDNIKYTEWLKNNIEKYLKKL